MGFAGSLTISAELLMDIVDAYLASLRRHGFERFVVMSSHGGNYPVLARWARERPVADTVVLSDTGVFEAGFEALRVVGAEQRVGRLRQVRPVLLGRGGAHHDAAHAAPQRRLDLRPAQSFDEQLHGREANRVRWRAGHLPPGPAAWPLPPRRACAGPAAAGGRCSPHTAPGRPARPPAT